MQQWNCIIAEKHPEEAGRLANLLQERRHCEKVMVATNEEELRENMKSGDIHALFVNTEDLDDDLMRTLDSFSKKPLIVLSNNIVEQVEQPLRVLRPEEARDLKSATLPKPAPGAPDYDFFFIRDQKKYVKIRYSDVLYIEANKNYLKIFLEKRYYMVVGSLSQLEKLLSPELFIRIHRSYIVPFNAISVVDKDSVMVYDKWLPLGEAYKKKLLGRLQGLTLGMSGTE
ncbi:MAG TPA: LytTR family DNA-binding domain-containing protein [Parasegetibacter sp.]|jgi:DNA-binding LytR/AlgR family response regulator